MRIALAVLTVALMASAGSNVAEANKRCPSNAARASLALWPRDTLNRSGSVVGMHPCGRQIMCTGGQRGVRGSRHCQWL